MIPYNTLLYGDNLSYLREMDSESVDLIYLDPPFNSKSTYNLLFHTPQGDAVQAQTAAFKDTWWWDTPAAQAFDDVIASGSPAAGILRALRSSLGESDMMAYLAMMAARLIELRRVLKPAGSLYLHCDPTASHYLKVLLDGLFGGRFFRNEIIWKRTSSHNDAAQGLKRFGRTHDVILYYSKGQDVVWNQGFLPYRESYRKQHYGNIEAGTDRRFKTSDLTAAKPGGDTSYAWKGVRPPAGRYWAYSRENMKRFEAEGRLVYAKASSMPRLKHYLDEMPGVPLNDLWDDIPPINSQAKERIGYPTQKPLALLERILRTSSAPGDVVLDPFCGCGTTIEAAESLQRHWIGIDVTHHAINIIEERLRARHPACAYTVKGRPEDLAGAEDLARRNPFEFQWWANWLLGVQNYLEQKKGADKGIDGIIYFRNGPWGVGQVIVSVKGGRNVGPDMVAALAGAVQREEAQLGVFVCLAEPTKRMRQDAAAAGFVTTAQGRFQRIQVATVAELLEGRRPPIPTPIETDAFRRPLRSPRAKKAAEPTAQLSLALPIVGTGKRSRSGAEEHLSGTVLARLGAG